MKIKHLLLLAVTLLLLTSCTDTTRRGTRLGDDFINTWRATGDLARVVAEHDAVVDSLTFGWQAGIVNNAFIERVESAGNDTMSVAARAIALGTDAFAEHYASQLIETLLNDDNFTPEQAGAQLTLVYTALGRVGRADLAEVYHISLDRLTRELPFDKQMRVYARAATPAELGRQLAAERKLPGVDTTEINHRFDALQHIYDDAQMVACRAAYEANR